MVSLSQLPIPAMNVRNSREGRGWRTWLSQMMVVSIRTYTLERSSKSLFDRCTSCKCPGVSVSLKEVCACDDQKSLWPWKRKGQLILAKHDVSMYYMPLFPGAASAAPEAFRRCSQAAPPVLLAPLGHTMAPQARMGACACACRLRRGEWSCVVFFESASDPCHERAEQPSRARVAGRSALLTC